MGRVDVEPGEGRGSSRAAEGAPDVSAAQTRPQGHLQRLLRACGYVADELAVIQTGEHISRVPMSYINYMVVFRRV